jgi:dTDP-4-dehydrorhamnose 3,5-epimerase-like enzyme
VWHVCQVWNPILEPIGEIRGAYQLRSFPAQDERGWFRDSIRLSSLPEAVAEEFSPQQVSVSNSTDGVVRGLHYSVTETSGAYFQTVTCAGGKVMDALCDIRLGSPTFGGIFRTYLSPASGITLLIPPGVGHAFKVVLAPAVLVYTMSLPFPLAQTRCIRTDSLHVRLWDSDGTEIISARDRSAPSMDEALQQELLPTWELSRS